MTVSILQSEVVARQLARAGHTGATWAGTRGYVATQLNQAVVVYYAASDGPDVEARRLKAYETALAGFAVRLFPPADGQRGFLLVAKTTEALEELS